MTAGGARELVHSRFPIPACHFSAATHSCRNNTMLSYKLFSRKWQKRSFAPPRILLLFCCACTSHLSWSQLGLPARVEDSGLEQCAALHARVQSQARCMSS
jgi:hypothetical protein